MKKFLSFLLILPACLSALAEPVPVERAKTLSEQFLRRADPSRTPQLQLLQERSGATKSGAADPEYYFFADARGGFVIAGGDDAVPPVLGYSLRGSFTLQDMPENLRGWLEMWQRIIRGERLKGAAAYSASAPLRSGSSKLLETAQWNQNDPFNLLCIEMGDKRVPTGCTATATAIVMRYHKWPDKGTGTIPSYSVADGETGKNYTIPAIELGEPYDWDKMPPKKYDGTWSDEQKNAVARLMRDVGVMIRSQYAPDGTGAYVEDVGPALVKYMNYDAGFLTDYKSLYDNDAEWVAKLEDNIDRVGPIVYGAYTESGGAGHAFVIDGYDEKDFLHINWGWGGNGDGYFVMPAFNEYTQGHQALLGMRKDVGGVAPENLQIYSIGLSSQTASFVQGTPFGMKCSYVGNNSTSVFEGELAFAKYDRYDKLVELVSEAEAVTIDPGMMISVVEDACVSKSPIKPGDYVRLLYRSASTPQWTPMRYSHTGYVIGKYPIGDTVFLDEIVSLEYVSSTGILTVSFSEQATRELRTAAGTKVTTGVTDAEDTMTIDTRQISPATYILHLQRGSQVRDIQLVIGLKK